MAPAQTTATLERVSWIRSEETSIVACAPRWTPPSPAEAKNGMPASSAATREEATVVAPRPPLARTTGRSRLETFGMPGSEANRSMSSSLMPTLIAPPSRQIVAGTAPPLRTAASTWWAVCALSG